jgi:hypothetical protein
MALDIGLCRIYKMNNVYQISPNQVWSPIVCTPRFSSKMACAMAGIVWGCSVLFYVDAGTVAGDANHL